VAVSAHVARFRIAVDIAVATAGRNIIEWVVIPVRGFPAEAPAVVEGRKEVMLGLWLLLLVVMRKEIVL
jgi:hypothetical protein